MTWMYAADESTLLEGSVAPVYPSGVHVVLARVEGRVYAMSGACAHMACPLSLGSLEGHTLTCACHDWRFDVRTGQFLDAPEISVPTYAVKSDAGRLFLSFDREDRR